MEQKSIKLNAILNVMKTVFSLVFPLITFPYVTRMLQVEAMGKYDFSGSIISYFTLLAALGINIYAVREGAKYRNDKEKIDQFASEIFSINVYSTIACKLLGKKIIISERNDPDKETKLEKISSVLFYRFADTVVVQTEDIAKKIGKIFHGEIRIIANPINGHDFEKNFYKPY